MTQHENDRSTNEPKASDMELIQILREAKNQDGVPALMTSQINNIGDFEYSGTGLNTRLSQLHDEELLGHQKAAGRNIWWLPSEGTTEEVELSSFEDFIDYSSLDPGQFSTQKAKEIANERVPDYGDDNWWQRIHSFGSSIFRAGVFVFALSFALAIVEPLSITTTDIGYILLLGLGLIGMSGVYLPFGRVGQALAKREIVNEEPFGGNDMLSHLKIEISRIVFNRR